jgi:hypothetical protein
MTSKMRGCNVDITEREGFMKRAVEMASGGMIL